MRKNHTARLRQFIAARCSPEGDFGRHLTLGVLLLLLAVWIFGSIADQVMDSASSPLRRFDLQFAQYLHAQVSPGLTRLMLVVTDVHGIFGVSVLGLLLGAYFLSKKESYWLLTTALAIPGGMLLNVVLKYTYMRARPSFDDAILSLATYSFPSGHTAAATLLYGVLGAYLVCLWPRLWVRSAVIVAAVAMVALVAASRVYLGVHYFSDVLAAVFESCGWLAVCITASATLQRRRAPHRSKTRGTLS